jgi:DNA helicase-2/ATP-dependent DNA helicase PcrA
MASSKINENKLKRKLTEASQKFQVEIDSLNLNISELIDKNTQLDLEKRLFERKVNENQLAQVAKEPIKKSLLKEVKLLSEHKGDEVNLVTFELDDDQQKLVEIKEGKHFVIAPPGAGKTAVLTKRLEHALDYYKDNDVVCLTFTTKAAKEMQQRASSIIGERNPFIGNFHTLCLDIYRNDKELPILRRFSSILPDEYRHDFFEKALAKVRAEKENIINTLLPNGISSLINLYSETTGDGIVYTSRTRFDRYLFYKIYPYFWLLQHDIDALRDFAKEQLKEPLLLAVIACHKSMYGSNQSIDLVQGAKCLWSVFSNFVEAKTALKSIDFDDLLCSGLLSLYQNPMPKKYVQVDEVQDLNPIQWKILEALTDQTTNLFVVGDKEQAIYGFLGAEIQGLETETSNFEKHYLLNNYRSDKPIVSLLNKYRDNVWSLPEIKSSKGEDSDSATMLITYNTQHEEFIAVQNAVSKILKDKKRNVGVLLSTNRAIGEICSNFSNAGLRYFRVSSNDLMQQEIIQDWISLIKAHKGTAQNVDWYNLTHHLTRYSGQATDSLKASISMVNDLAMQGVTMNDIITSATKSSSLYSYRLNHLINAWDKGDVVIFDTETTGLDFESSRIIQIAAVKVRSGEVLEVFDQFINIDVDSAEPELLIAYEESLKIHNITKEQLEKGKSELSVLTDFFDFIGDSPLIAHNMNFDNTMLRMAVMRTNKYDLQKMFHQISAFRQFDTLLLARGLLPDEPSYKLGALLEKYQLEGDNSHNALDDVKATSSLLTFLINKAKLNIDNIDQIIDKNASLISKFTESFEKLNNILRSYYATGSKVNLSDILVDWLDFAAHQTGWYNLDPADIPDIKNKLVNWLDDNNYKGHIHELFDEMDPKTQVLFTLKESDLINPDKDKLIVSTIHRAKGLEFDTVIIPQVNDRYFPGWLPDDSSEHEKQAHKEEKERLLYVAMSRPTKKLIMTYHLHGHSGNREYNASLYGPISECKDSFQYIR